MTVCANGHANDEGQSFCGRCGAPLAHDATPSSPSTHPPSENPPTEATPGNARLGQPAGWGVPAPPHVSGAEVPTVGRSRRRWAISIAALAALLALGGTTAFVLLDKRGPDAKQLAALNDAKYLAALSEAGLRNAFPADRAALSNASAACQGIDAGGKAQGTEADKIGIQFYCPDYYSSFKVLEKMAVTGTFTVNSYETGSNIGSRGCEGSGGYGDVNASTAVVVTNTKGDTLTRTELGSGMPGPPVDSPEKNHIYGWCEFTFHFDVTEGEDSYVVRVGDRGEVGYTFDELRVPGAIALSLG